MYRLICSVSRYVWFTRRCGQILLGSIRGRGHRIHGQCRNQVVGRRKDKRKSLATGTPWHNKLFACVFHSQTDSTGTYLWILRREEHNAAFRICFAAGLPRDTTGVVRTNSTNPLLMNVMVGECHSPEENTLQYLIPVCSSMEGNMMEAREVVQPPGFGSYHWHNHGTRAVALAALACVDKITARRLGSRWE